MKGMADSLHDQSEHIPKRTLVLKFLCGLSRRYDHMKALIKQTVSFPSFHDVRNELLLKDLTIDNESHTPTMALRRVLRGQPPRTLTTRGGGHVRLLLPKLLIRLLGPTAVADPARAATLLVVAHRPQRQAAVAVILQPLDRDHLHVAGLDQGCFFAMSPTTGSPDDALLRSPSTFSGSSTLLIAGSASPPAPRDPCLDTLVPLARRWDQASLAASFGTMVLTLPHLSRLGGRLRRFLPHYCCQHVISLSSSSSLSSFFYHCGE